MESGEKHKSPKFHSKLTKGVIRKLSYSDGKNVEEDKMECEGEESYQDASEDIID